MLVCLQAHTHAHTPTHAHTHTHTHTRTHTLLFLSFVADNVEVIVRLAGEYQIEQKREECVRLLLSQRASFDRLVLAQELGLEELEEKCMDYAIKQRIEDIESYFKDLSTDTFIDILKEKCFDIDSKLSRVRMEANALSREHSLGCRGIPYLRTRQQYGQDVEVRGNWKVSCFACIRKVLFDALNY